MILLDTHALIWLVQGNSRLGNEARRMSDEALAQDRLCVSAVSFWEAAMLAARGRITLPTDIEFWREDILASGLKEISLEGEVAIRAVQLADFHADPADRFITATAQSIHAVLITADRDILAWPGNLRRHNAKV